ncbi:leucine-rich repeat-containing protein 59-like [Anopheles moucheti]|uniref:leucine-rich repeat-containing protein 59-like n=1 Tax=Anopheles moucheti TaxID=186751 RepID=UPI0022EFDD61|nr:leucine-rich repeat-containing protein 59-like [Anopheles moucheti]
MAMQQHENEEKINVRDRLVDNVLDLSLMNISKVPVQEIKPLRRATVLDLSSNRISIIESNFTDLTQLTQIDLSKNRITSICDDFGLLTNLRRLDLYKNQITKLPLTLGRLKNLKYLDLKENPLNPVFKKFIGTCSDTNDCLTAATRAVEFMKLIERRVVEDRVKERKLRGTKQHLQEEQLKEEMKITTEEEKPTDEQKSEKSKRKRKHIPQGDASSGDDPKSKPKSGKKANRVDGETMPSGFRHSFLFWLCMLVTLVVSFLLCAKYYDMLPPQAPETILEEYIK